ncbi:PREDICTED: uncharacterized protein LOC107343052 isoform X2 [Acropora digitifera]|uniref:uncharacterized protein LOC107343052 isoform X2 n=1 Tax=Acropora digitifera TaxID=70779 RepID=UPI00077A97C3|nr:PREDICTED: uncharacterized protein LOC107343052 isoform X2 [Acropora digitifera]
MDFVIGHGIHLGRQVPLIKRVHQECKWIQVVHTDPEELGMFKNYADSIAKGEKKHQAEVKLCELADQVVAIGPKLEEVFSRYLRFCGKDQDVLTLTPGIFSEFADVPQAAEERGKFRVLVFGRGESEDFYLKGYDIAARAVAELCKHEPHIFKLVFVGAPKGGEGLVSEMLLKEGITLSQLIVRSYKEREQLAVQFCEADLAIMPSRTEGFGLAALEALSAGLPVLVSGNSGFGESLKELPFGSSCVVNSEDASEWAKAIRAIHDKKGKLRLSEAVKLRESYAKKYHWEGECGRLVERMLNIIQDQTVAADNLGEQGPSSVSESVSYPDTTTLQHVVCDFVGSGRENVIQEERPRTYHLTITEGREGLNAVIPEISLEGRSVEKQGSRPFPLHPSARPPVKDQRRDTDILRGTSTSQALAADDSMEQQTVVTPEGTSGGELSKFGGTQGKQPATKTTRQDSLFTSKHSEIAMRSETCVEPTQSGISYAVSSEGQSVKKQERRSLHLHPRALPPVKKQRRDTGIRRAMVQCLASLCCFKNTAQDQAVAAVNLGEQGPSSVSESVSYPDATTTQHIVGDAVSSGRENVIQEERPRTYPLTTTVGRQRLHASIPEIPSDGRSVLTQGRRSLHLHPSATSLVMKQRLVTDIRTGTQGKQPATKTRQDSLFTSKHSEIATRSESCLEPTQSGNFYAVSSEGRSVKQRRRSLYLHPSITPPVKEQRHDTDIRRVFNDNSVLVKLLRAEYNRRAQLRPLFWDSTIQLPLEKVYTRLKIVSRHRGGNQGETERWSDVIWAEDSRREGICAEAQANKANPCNVFSMLKENKDLMTIVEGSPGIGKTTFCLKLACDWANQSSSAASCPEFELVLLVKCRDIDGDLTEAITEQLFPKDLSKDAREELLRFLEDIENQERVLIILDGLDELAEKSKHYVDDLLHRKRWACCYVLTTTRQEKGIEVRKQPEFVFNLFLQIEGFTEKDSFQYIRRHFKISGPEHSSMGEKLIEEIKENSFLRDLQTNPLNLLLLCIVYEDHEGKLPSSRTNLYQVIVVCLLRRYCARHNVKAGKEDMDLEKQFERDIRCLGKLAWNCLLNDRHSFFEEEFEELESRNEKLVARRLGFVYKEESLKVLKPHHEYCFLHKSFQEFLAASYIALKLRRKNLNVFEHLDFDAVINKFSQVFVFVCGILREEASILFEQIGEKLESDWDWLECREAAANFLIKSWNESGNAEGMASTFCSFMPFPRIVHLLCHHDYKAKDWNLLRVLLFCSRFSKVEAPDEIHLRESSIYPLLQARLRDLPFLRNLKSLQWVFFFECLYGT